MPITARPAGRQWRGGVVTAAPDSSWYCHPKPILITCQDNCRCSSRSPGPREKKKEAISRLQFLSERTTPEGLGLDAHHSCGHGLVCVCRSARRRSPRNGTDRWRPVVPRAVIGPVACSSQSSSRNHVRTVAPCVFAVKYYSAEFFSDASQTAIPVLKQEGGDLSPPFCFEPHDVRTPDKVPAAVAVRAFLLASLGPAGAPSAAVRSCKIRTPSRGPQQSGGVFMATPDR